MYQVYEIMNDETLESIAIRMNFDSEELCRLNGMNEQEFVPGQFIVIPKIDDLYSSYIVKSGDTLFDISKRYNIDLNILYALNGLDDGDYIYPNQELILPKDNTLMYITVQGDNLESISNNLGVSYNELVDSVSNLSFVPDQLIAYKRG